MASKIVLFHSGRGIDHAGRTRDAILAWDNDKLESVHDYIQWLFPTDKPSRFNHRAPVLTSEDITEFQGSKELQISVLKGYDRMCQFFSETHPWDRPNDHNLLRITRILDCMTTVGLRTEAEQFFEMLSEVGESKVSATTIYHWKMAVT